MKNNLFKESVILADISYIDWMSGALAEYLSSNLGRPFPSADMAQWAVCTRLEFSDSISCDDQTQVLLIYGESPELKHILPSNLLSEVDGMAFTDEQCGEFELSVVKDETLEGDDPLLLQCVEVLLSDKNVRRLVIAPGREEMTRLVAKLVEKYTDKQVALLAPCHLECAGAKVTPLTWPLMCALGVQGNELESIQNK